MHPADIQAALKKKGITQAALAEELGVTTFHMSEVVNKKRISDRVMRAIAQKLGRKPDHLFPEYYHGPKKRVHSKAFGK